MFFCEIYLIELRLGFTVLFAAGFFSGARCRTWTA